MKLEILIETTEENNVPTVKTFSDLQKAEIYFRNKISDEKNEHIKSKTVAKLINRENHE